MGRSSRRWLAIGSLDEIKSFWMASLEQLMQI
jgi:hypothetical protein